MRSVLGILVLETSAAVFEHKEGEEGYSRGRGQKRKCVSQDTVRAGANVPVRESRFGLGSVSILCRAHLHPKFSPSSLVMVTPLSACHESGTDCLSGAGIYQ